MIVGEILTHPATRGVSVEDAPPDGGLPGCLSLGDVSIGFRLTVLSLMFLTLATGSCLRGWRRRDVH